MIEVTTSALAGHPFLHGMPRGYLAVVAPAVADMTLPARHRIVEDVGHATRFWLIRSGRVALHVQVAGEGPVITEVLAKRLRATTMRLIARPGALACTEGKKPGTANLSSWASGRVLLGRVRGLRACGAPGPARTTGHPPTPRTGAGGEVRTDEQPH